MLPKRVSKAEREPMSFWGPTAWPASDRRWMKAIMGSKNPPPEGETEPAPLLLISPYTGRPEKALCNIPAWPGQSLDNILAKTLQVWSLSEWQEGGHEYYSFIYSFYKRKGCPYTYTEE